MDTEKKYEYFVSFVHVSKHDYGHGHVVSLNERSKLYKDDLDKLAQKIKESKNADGVTITNIIPLPIVHPDHRSGEV